MGVVAALAVRITANTADFEKQLSGLESKFSSLGGSLSSIGAKMSAGITLPLIAAGTAMVKVGKNFDDASDSIRAATGATGKNLDSLNSSFKAVLGTVPASMADTATAISDLSVRTGLTGSALETMSAQMLNLARMTGSEIGPLIANTTRLFGDWSISTDKQSGALDFLFKTSQATGIEVDRLSALVVQFGAPLRALGFDFEQAAALMGKWEKEGVNLETVLSGLRFALGNFAKAGLEPKAALEAVISKIQAAKTESEATGIAFQVFGKRAAIDMSRAIIEGRFNIDELVTSLKNSKETINGAAASTLSLGERMTLLANKIQLAVEPLATKLVGALEQAVNHMMPLVEWAGKLIVAFTNLPQPIQTAAFGVLAFVAALGPILIIAGQIIGSFGNIMRAAHFVATGFTSIGSAAAAAGITVGGGTVVGVLALAAGFALLAVKIHESIQEFGLWMTARNGFIQAAAGGAFGPIVQAAFSGGGGGSNRSARVMTGTSTGKGKDTHLPSGSATGDPVKDALAKAGIDPAALDKLMSGKGKKDRVNPFSGADLFNDAAQAMKDVADIGGITKLTADETKRLHETLDKAIEKYHEIGKTVPLDMAQVWGATMQANTAVTGLSKTLLAGIGTQVQPTPFLSGGPGVAGMPDVLPGATGVVPGAGIKLPGLLEQMFGSPKDFASSISGVIMGALTGGGGIGKSLGGFLGGEGIKGITGKLTGMLGEKGIGGALGGILGSVLPGVGNILGALGGSAISGLFGKLFGGEKKKTNQARDAFIEQAGGIDALKKSAEEAGFSLDKLLSTKKVKDFQGEVGKLTSAMEAHKATMQAISDITEGVNARAANVTGQGDLDVVGAGAVAAFALQMQSGSTAIAAFQALTPAITAMSTAMATGNFTLSESAMRLTELGAILNANNVEFTNLGASGQILQAMLQGNIRDGTLFAAVATDIGTQIQTVIDRGVPMAQVFALAQPQLQALWEAQQKWGFAVDETTQRLLTEAAAQGFVGQQMKSVNQQILDVLLAIGKVLGADIPAAFANLPAAAQSAANGINAAFASVNTPSIQDSGAATIDVPAMASGGIVRRPTLALIGEAGPEAVVPLNGAFNTGGGTAVIEVDGRVLARVMVPHIPGEVQRYGLV